MPDYEVFLGIAVVLFALALSGSVLTVAVRFVLGPLVKDIAKQLGSSRKVSQRRLERLERVLVELDRRVSELADTRTFERALGEGDGEGDERRA